MHPLAGDALLALWERGATLHPIDRALHVLAYAAPGRDPEALARLPLGVRDALLLAARRATLGERIEAQDACPACGERIEVALACSALAAGEAPPSPEWPLEAAGYRLRLRPLDSHDAAASAQAGDVAAARALLLARCVVAAERDGESVPPAAFPEAVAAAAAASLAAHDGAAELMLSLACPRCGHAWSSVLDVASFVWTELVARAQHLLRDVHALARAYGWREADILALSDARRAAYLALATA